MTQKNVGADSISAHQRGITLVALVVTIVVLLILAGVTINMLFSDNGIIKKAQEAANKMNEAVQNDQTQLNELYNELANVIDGNNKPVEPELPADGSFNVEKGVNTPKLGTGMTPVKWDETNQKFVETTRSDKDWYDYNTQKWANAITTDGSYWVWIPRYSYQIADNYHTNSATGGTINVEFMKGTTNESSTGRTSFQNASGQGNWNIHPAFNYGSEVAGIWVAKYEASQSDSSTSSAGSSNIIKIQPTVQSWRNITVNDIYTKCLNYNTSSNSHMMKNSEWGAVAYLAQSSYGKNSEVWINPNSNCITGQVGKGASAEGTTSTYAYNDTTYGVQASTTGNVYGIYDMSGGAYEYTASYVNNSYATSNRTGNSLINGEAKTKDVYSYNSSLDNQTNNYAANSSKYGDAVYETSSNTTSPWNLSWYYDYSSFPYSSGLFFFRGGSYANATIAGIFAFTYDIDIAYIDYGFRPVLVTL